MTHDLAAIVAEMRALVRLSEYRDSVVREVGAWADRIESAMAQEREGWRPIETAPKDGTPILLGWDDEDHIPVVGYWNEDRYSRKPSPYWTCDRVRSWGIRELRACQPTHWMPLPAAPTGGSET